MGCASEALKQVQQRQIEVIEFNHEYFLREFENNARLLHVDAITRSDCVITRGRQEGWKTGGDG